MSSDSPRHLFTVLLLLCATTVGCGSNSGDGARSTHADRQWADLVVEGADAETLYRLGDGDKAPLPIRADSLFLGYRFDMPRERFFEHSWELNRQGKVVNGGGAEIVAETTLKGLRARMSFYPVFLDDRIYEMPVTYSYSGWSPWNRSLWSDSLMTDLRRHLGDSLGVRFEAFPDLSSSTASLYDSAQILMGRQSSGVTVRLAIVDEKRVEVRYLAALSTDVGIPTPTP